jgi:hypothetical protein
VACAVLLLLQDVKKIADKAIHKILIVFILKFFIHFYFILQFAKLLADDKRPKKKFTTGNTQLITGGQSHIRQIIFLIPLFIHLLLNSRHARSKSFTLLNKIFQLPVLNLSLNERIK